MKLDRDKFFAAYRMHFGPLSQSQVDGLTGLLDAAETDDDLHDPRHLAYMLATVKHECADTWQPIVERGNRTYFDKYEPGTRIGKNLGNTQQGDGYRYRGRGYVQLTGRPNYQKMAEVCDVDLAGNPDFACVAEHAYRIMAHGFRHGSFTGKKLDSYINAGTCDYRQARRCINGLDKCDLIASYATKLERVINEAIA